MSNVRGKPLELKPDEWEHLHLALLVAYREGADCFKDVRIGILNKIGNKGDKAANNGVAPAKAVERAAKSRRTPMSTTRNST